MHTLHAPTSPNRRQPCEIHQLAEISTPALLPFLQYIDREEKEQLQRAVRHMTGLDPLSAESEQRLVELLERFDIVPTTAVKRSLMEWKVKGWVDVFKWKTQP